MNIETREEEYRNIAMQLVNTLRLSESKVIATIGFLIALSKSERLSLFANGNRIDDIFHESIELDNQVSIRLEDLSNIRSTREAIREIIHIIAKTSELDHAKLFEEVIVLYAPEEERKRGLLFQPKELTHLVSSILGEYNVETVYNPFAGIGSYQLANKNIAFTSQELNRDLWVIGKLRMYINNIYGEYKCEDSISYWIEDYGEFDAIVSTPPFMMRLSREQKPTPSFEDLHFQHNIVETLFFSRAIESIKEDGVVIGVVPSNILLGSTTHELRKHLITSGLVREVIQLPRNIFKATAISTAIVVLSKRCQNQIRFIDASEYCSKRWAGNTLDWKKILELRNLENSESVRFVNNDEVSEQDYNLLPARYLEVEEATPDGYQAIELRELVSVQYGNRRNHESNKGHIVNVGDLSSDGLYSKVEIDNLPFGEINSNFRRITSPVLLISKFRFLNPTYIEASTTNPIYISPSIMALNVDSTKIYIPYLAYELSLKSDRLQRGIITILPYFQRDDILNLIIHIPSLSTQDEVLSQERAIIESLILADKNAKIKEHGLEEIIKMREQELFRLISLRKHRINPYFSGMQDNIVLLRDEFKASGAIALDHKITPNYTVEDMLNNLERQVADVKDLFKNLTSELVIEERKAFDFVRFMESYKYVNKIQT